MKTAFVLGAIIACCPAVLMAQTSTKTTPQAQPAPAMQHPTTRTSNGDVGGAGDMTESMMAGQKNASLIGSPAWWSSHSTADGKPLSTNKR